MASAVLVSRDETRNFLSASNNHKNSSTMGKIPNPNPNNNQFSRKQFNHHYPNHHHLYQNGDDLANSYTVSDDASSFNQHRKLVNVDGEGPDGGNGIPLSLPLSFSHYVSYNITNYSRSELRLLKSRLISELDKVRSLSSQIESSNHNHKKRPSPFEAPAAKRRQSSTPYVASPQLMKECAKVLNKVMKQKAGYIFNEPVDVIGMGLHDYHQIIKRPMDLGTIKRNLSQKGYYPTPEEFASDVRLTFNNALLYNPKGHEVHNLAEKFLAKFEQDYHPVYCKFLLEKQHAEIRLNDDGDSGGVGDNGGNAPPASVVDEVQWSKNPSPEPPVIEVSEHRAERVSGVEKDQAVVPIQDVVAVQVHEVGRRGPSGKLPKPKAKDLIKREMSKDEKHKLGAGLQSLPEEKMTQVINIIRKRNGHLTQDGDEIELDIEAVDTETLWELDRLVTNYKKMVSKLRRQALMQNNNVGHNDDTNQVGMSERVTETAKAVKRVGGDVGDEDVDIGDEMPVHNFPPVEIDKDDDRNQGDGDGGGGCGGDEDSSSSSSGSDSSSSSDSDSGSSSGSDSDVDDAQSRHNESKNNPH